MYVCSCTYIYNICRYIDMYKYIAGAEGLELLCARCAVPR